jgi:hypothetical protein
MKLKLLAIAIAVTLSGCSTFSSKNEGNRPAADATIPVKDTKITTNFVDEGVKITYTMTGKLEKIEVVGVAPAWKRNHDIIAEADAMDKLVKFVHGKNVTSDRRVKIISRALDNASDITNNKYRSNDGSINTDSKELEAEVKSGSGEETQKDNTARRNARIVDETTVNAVQTITASGRLVGVRKISDDVKDDGKTYVAYYQWSKRDMAAAIEIRNEMLKGQ